jgi:hypothetical protein
MFLQLVANGRSMRPNSSSIKHLFGSDPSVGSEVVGTNIGAKIVGTDELTLAVAYPQRFCGALIPVPKALGNWATSAIAPICPPIIWGTTFTPKVFIVE